MARSALFLALVVLALVGSAVASPQLLTRLRYRNWKLTNGKSYTEAEDEYRFRVFSQNMERVRLLNEQTNVTRYDLGPFADLTEEEFLEMPCGGDLTKLPGEAPEVSAFESNGLASPASFDWRDKGALTPVKNQGQCGSCWAFSAVGNVEGVNFLSGRKLQGFAEQQYVDCGKQSFGCGGGWPYWAFQDALQYQQGGLESEASYPYTARNGQCSYDSGEAAVTLRNYKSYCTTSTAKCDENQMKDMLVQLGPLSVCLNATPMQFYQGGVDNPTSCSPSMINHCVTLAGYGTDSASGLDFWLIKNSWGTSWGEQGYYRLVRGKGACGINSAITVAQL